MMLRKGLIIGAFLVIIAIPIVLVVLSNPSRDALKTPTPIPTRPPTLTLHEITTIPVWCVYFSADWSLAGGGGKVFDTTTGQVRINFKLDTGEVSFSSDLAYVGATDDGVYSVSSAQRLFPLKGKRPAVSFTSIPQFSPDNKRVAVVYDGVYELPSGKKIMSLNEKQVELFYSPDSRYLAIVGDGVYDPATGQRLFAIGGPTDAYQGDYAEFSPDGKYLVVRGVGIYQVDIAKLIVPTDMAAFSPDSSLATTPDGIYDLANNKWILPQPGGSTLSLTSGLGRDGRFSRDGQRVLLELGPSVPSTAIPPVLKVYDVPTGKTLLQIAGLVGVISPDGALLAVYNDGVYDIASGKKRFSFSGEAFPVFSPDSSVLFISNVGAYDTYTGDLRFRIKEMRSISSDGRLVSDDQGLYEVATGARLADGKVTFQPNGNKVSIMPVQKQDSCKIAEVVPFSSAATVTP